MKKCVAIVLFAVFLGACAQEKWEAVVYPNSKDRTSGYSIFNIASLEGCRYVAIEYLKELSSLANGDYE